MTTLGAALTAMTDTALCDRHQHEVVLVTDGQRAYVYPLDDHAEVTGNPTVCRTGVTLGAECPLPGDDHEGRCGGQLTWRLDAEGTWGADADAMRLLTAYGMGVEQ